MSSPQTVTVPPLAGVGMNVPIQIPDVSSGNPTLINQSTFLTVTVCADSLFQQGTSWTLEPGESLPLPNGNGTFITNPNNAQITILVLDGIVPVQFSDSGDTGHGLTIVSVSGATPTAVLTLLPAPPVGYAYRLNNLYMFFQGIVSASGTFELFIVGPSNFYYYMNIFTMATGIGGNQILYAQAPINMNGQLVNEALEWQANPQPAGTGAATGHFFLGVSYDLVPI